MFVMRPRDRGPEPGPGRGASLLQRGADREGGGVPQRPAVDLRRADGDRARRAGADRAAPAGAARGDPAARCSRAPRSPPRSRSRPASPRCRCPPSRASGPRTSASSPRTGSAGAGDVAKSQAIGAGFAALGGAVLVFGMRRFGPRWWIPGAAVVVAFGAITTYAGPVVLDPLFNDFKRAAARRAALRRARAGAQGRRRRGRGLRDGRLAPHDRRERVRDRARPHQARRALRHAGQRLHAGRDAPRRRARARPRALPRRAQRADLARDRRAVRHVGGRAAGRAAGAARRARSARARCPPSRCRWRSSCPVITMRLQPALARRRAARGRVLARADAAIRSTFIDFQQRIAVKNVSDPDPPALARFLLGTHPTTLRADRPGGGVPAVKYTVVAVGRIRAAVRRRRRALREDARRPREGRPRRGRATTSEVERRIPERAYRVLLDARGQDATTRSRSRAGWRIAARAGATSAS